MGLYTKYLAALSFSALILSGFARAESDCELHCAVVLFSQHSSYLSSALTRTEAEMLNYGNSVGALLSATVSGFDSWTASIAEGSKTRIAHNHALAEKLETLHLKQRITDRFGSVISEAQCLNCSEGSESYQPGRLIREQIEDSSQKRQATIATTSRTVRDWSELPVTAEDIAKIISGDLAAAGANFELIVQLLSESTTFPKKSAKSETQAIAYNMLFQERLEHMKIVRGELSRHFADSAFPLSKESIEYRQVINQAADLNIDGAAAYTKNGLVEVLGHSTFGSNSAIDTASKTGDELYRLLSFELAKKQFIASQRSLLLSSITNLRSIDNSIINAVSYGEDLKTALRNLN